MTSHSRIVQNVKEKYTKTVEKSVIRALEVKVAFINYYMTFEMTSCVDCVAANSLGLATRNSVNVVDIHVSPESKNKLSPKSGI